MISIIINPVSGGASATVAAHRARLAVARLDVGGEPGEVVLTERRGHAHELAAAAARRGDRVVVAWGGDGTVNEVASALVGTTTSLGVVPSGSGNGLARELGIPSAPERALDLAMSASARTIDAGQLGGRWFFSVAGIGFDAHVAAEFDRATGRRGLSTYARIIAREFFRYRCGRYRVDGGPATTALLITFANSAQFGNGARIAPDARIDDGLLDLVVFEERTRLASLLALPSLFTGGVSGVRGVSIRRVMEAVIESDRPMPFHVDGEPCHGESRLEARLFAAVLRVAALSEGG